MIKALGRYLNPKVDRNKPVGDFIPKVQFSAFYPIDNGKSFVVAKFYAGKEVLYADMESAFQIAIIEPTRRQIENGVMGEDSFWLRSNYYLFEAQCNIQQSEEANLLFEFTVYTTTYDKELQQGPSVSGQESQSNPKSLAQTLNEKLKALTACICVQQTINTESYRNTQRSL